MKTYLGPDGTKRTKEEYLNYLERCARLWEEGFACKPSPEQAARVRAIAKKIEKED